MLVFQVWNWRTQKDRVSYFSEWILCNIELWHFKEATDLHVGSSNIYFFKAQKKENLKIKRTLIGYQIKTKII